MRRITRTCRARSKKGGEFKVKPKGAALEEQIAQGKQAGHRLADHRGQGGAGGPQGITATKR